MAQDLLEFDKATTNIVDLQKTHTYTYRVAPQLNQRGNQGLTVRLSLTAPHYDCPACFRLCLFSRSPLLPPPPSPDLKMPFNLCRALASVKTLGATV